MGLLARSWEVLGFHVLLSGVFMGLLVRSGVVFGVHALYCISLLHILISYVHCLSSSHISVAYLYCLCLLHIFIAYSCCISVLHIYIAYLCCRVVVFCRLGLGVDVWSFGGCLGSIFGRFGGSEGCLGGSLDRFVKVRNQYLHSGHLVFAKNKV